MATDGPSIAINGRNLAFAAAVLGIIGVVYTSVTNLNSYAFRIETLERQELAMSKHIEDLNERIGDLNKQIAQLTIAITKLEVMSQRDVSTAKIPLLTGR